MAKIFATFVLVAIVACLLPSAAFGIRGFVPKAQFVVRGRVFCDTCRLGYETSASTYLPGAKVTIECMAKDTGKKTCSFPGETDHTGTYNIAVTGEHEFENCEAALVSSAHMGCSTMVQYRDRARVFLTTNNGMASNIRFANALGFEAKTPLAVCSQILKQYEENDV